MTIQNRRDAALAVVGVCGEQVGAIDFIMILGIVMEILQMIIDKCSENATEFVGVCRAADTNRRGLTLGIMTRLRQETSLRLVRRVLLGRALANSMVDVAMSASDEELRVVYKQ